MTHKQYLISNINYPKSAESSLDMQDMYKGVILAIVAAIVALLVLAQLGVLANNDIMHVIDSPILRGRNDFVDKYSIYISGAAQAIITICGVAILTVKAITISFTILFLANPTFWDSVQDSTENRQGHKENGDWMSTIVGYVVPNIRKYSDYGQIDDDRMYEIGGVQTIGAYFKANLVQMVILVTFASLMWSGKFLKLVGKISEGCIVIVDAAISIDYGGKVSGLLESERDFIFVYDKATVIGRHKEKLAKSLYGQVKTAINDNSTSVFYSRVGEKVKDEVDNIEKALNGNSGQKHHINMTNPTLSYSIAWNADKPSDLKNDYANTGVYVVTISDLLGTPTGNEAGKISVKEATVGQKGAIYITFNASQNYSPNEGDPNVTNNGN